MDLLEAIDERISCRAFDQRPIDPETFNLLAENVERINLESGLHFQLYGPRDDGTVISMNRRMFANDPAAYFAFVAPQGPLPEERLGYYGEQLVLLATQLGLGSCWVASTYDKESTRVELAEGEVLHDVAPLGYKPDKMPLVQATIRRTLRGKSKKPAALLEGPVAFSDAPAWIQSALEAVWKAPSAVNGQPIRFRWEGEGTPVQAVIAQNKIGLEHTDLGIAKQHFKVAATMAGVEGSWEWGDGGAYLVG